MAELDDRIRAVEDKILLNQEEERRLRDELAELHNLRVIENHAKCPHSRGFIPEFKSQSEYCPDCYLTRDLSIGVG